MRTADLFQVALRGLFTNKSRSVLTMLGIVIGVASVMLMMSLGKGAENLILGQIAGLGTDSVFIEPGSGDQHSPVGIRWDVLTDEDVKAIDRLPSVEFTTPLFLSEQQVVYGNQNEKATVAGGNEHGVSFSRGGGLTAGRDLDVSEISTSSRVALLGSEIAQALFEGQSPIGQVIKIGGRVSATVVGVLEPQGSQFFQNLDRRVYLPWPVVQRELLGISYVHFIGAKSRGDVPQAVDDIRELLRTRHRIDNPENDLSKDDFAVRTQAEAANILGTVSIALTIFLSAIAAISLVVGGIGIMNIMLVSVTERTREIGLRKAVGARERDLLWQFLIEAVTLTASGGLVGILLGIAGAWLGALIAQQYVPEWQFSVPPRAVALSVGVATLVGLVFGIYPARRAAKLNPIEALRYE